jgi:hypothetical protein
LTYPFPPAAALLKFLFSSSFYLCSSPIWSSPSFTGDCICSSSLSRLPLPPTNPAQAVTAIAAGARAQPRRWRDARRERRRCARLAQAGRWRGSRRERAQAVAQLGARGERRLEQR